MLKKALIVDDNEMILTFLSTILTKKFSLRVITAKDGLKALAELTKGGIEIIFLDIMMPNLDGIGFLEKIREDTQFCHLPVVIVSAVKDREMIAKLVKLGIKDYLLKPLEFLKTTEKLNDLFAEYD
jgi:CheY-like chemotaxis protein